MTTLAGALLYLAVAHVMWHVLSEWQTAARIIGTSLWPLACAVIAGELAVATLDTWRRR